MTSHTDTKMQSSVTYYIVVIACYTESSTLQMTTI